MKRIRSLLAVLAVAVFLPLSALAERIPAIPVAIHGTVTVDGATPAIGTIVKAEEDGAEVASYALKSAGTYLLEISEDKVAVGKAIHLKVNGKEAGQVTMPNVNYVPAVKYDLAITTNTSTPSGPSSGGGGGGSYTPKPKPPVDDEEEDEEEEEGDLGGDDNGKVKGETSVNVIDGDIIQCKNSANPFAVYIVKIVGNKKYIRHIVSLEIFNHYKHIRWENLIQVSSLEGFSLSGWVRVNTGPNGMAGPHDKVWEINGDQTRHWIDMTAQEFLLHGGSEEAIYSINQGELNLYKIGAAVKLI